MKISVSGYKGKIGQRLVALGALPLKCNVMDEDDILHEINRVEPDVIIHAAAKSNVDFCQDNYSTAFDVNATGTSILGKVANKKYIKTIVLSSEQVYDGRWGRYKEKHKANP
jgi:dTDP-4-dehydrorhamnose reductase